MKINKEQLLKALEIVKPGLASKELIAQSTSFAFINGRVITYNDEISISHPIEGLELEGAILAENLYKFLGKIKKDDVEFEVTGNEIILTSGRSKAGLTLQSEINLPLDEEIAEVGKWFPLPKDFIENIKFVMTAASKDMSQQILTCVHVNENGYVEASDGYCGARQNLSSEMPIKSFLIPAANVVDMVHLNPTRISEGKGWIHFRTREGTIISCRIYDKDVFPSMVTFFQTEGVQLLLPNSINEALDLAMVFAKRDHILDEVITISLQYKLLEISAESESGWFKEELEIKYEGNLVTISITPYMFKGILAKTQAGILSSKKLKFEGEGWIYVAMLRSAK